MIDIIKGHVSELFKLNEEMSERRLAVCKECPLYIYKYGIGYICDKSRTVNPTTNEESTENLPGYYRGCNCRLEAKTRLETNHCPAGRW